MALKKINSSLGEIPHPFRMQEGIFDDIHEARFAIRGVLRAYFGESKDPHDDYLFFRSGAVRFEKNPEVDLELDHRRRTIVFILQEPQGKDAKTLKSRLRNHVVMQFAALASDSRGRTAMSIYRSLAPNAKRHLINSEKQKERRHVRN